MPQLRARPGSAALAVEFAILTGARSGEVRGMPRRELNLDAKTWTIPKERMKAKLVHRIPLSTAALASLERIHVDEFEPDNLVFPGSGLKTPLSDIALTMVLRRMNVVNVSEVVPSRFPLLVRPDRACNFPSHVLKRLSRCRRQLRRFGVFSEDDA